MEPPIKDALRKEDDLIVYKLTTVIKDTLNKGHLCIEDTFQHTNLYSGNTFLSPKEDILSIMDKMIRPNVSII